MNKILLFLKDGCFFLMALLSSALAADTVAQENIEELLVEGYPLAKDNVWSTKVPVPAIDIPQSLSIVSKEQIEMQSLNSVADVLQYTPGVVVSQGEGHRDAIVIRGNRSTADFFIDGIRDDAQYFRPLYNVEQIEIVRGANALLFGRGGGGGVINRITKKPEIGTQFGNLRTRVDTFGAYSFWGDANIAVFNNAAFRINAYYQEINNHRDFVDGNSFAFNPIFKINLTPNTTALFSYEYIYRDQVVDRGVPSVTGTAPLAPLEGYENTFFGSPFANLTKVRAHIMKSRFEHQFSDAVHGDMTVVYANYDKLYQNLYPSESVAVTNGVFSEVTLDGYRDPTKRENVIAQANLNGNLNTGFIDHSILVGAEYGRQNTDNMRYDIVFTRNNDDQLTLPFTDPLNIPAFAFTDLARDRKSNVEFTSVYFQDQMDIGDHFKLVAGARYDTFDIDVLDIQAGDMRFSNTDDKITPRIGGIYKPMERLSFYISYGASFLPRSGDQFLTLNLDTANTRAQRIKNYETGLKWNIQPALSMTASAFKLKRESYTVPSIEDPSVLRVIRGAEVTGFELQLTGEVTDKWFLNTGYSYLDGKIKQSGSSDDGKVTRETPEHMFSIWNLYQINSKLKVALGLIYKDNYFACEDNSVRIPDYVRVDAGVYYDVTEKLRLQLNIDNLLNEDYFPSSHNNNNISTGAPLSASVTLVKNF